MVLDEIASPAARKFGLLNPTTKDISWPDFASRRRSKLEILRQNKI